jgi:hypothetical protein
MVAKAAKMRRSVSWFLGLIQGITLADASILPNLHKEPLQQYDFRSNTISDAAASWPMQWISIARNRKHIWSFPRLPPTNVLATVVDSCANKLMWRKFHYDGATTSVPLVAKYKWIPTPRCNVLDSRPLMLWRSEFKRTAMVSADKVHNAFKCVGGKWTNVSNIDALGLRVLRHGN